MRVPQGRSPDASGSVERAARSSQLRTRDVRSGLLQSDEPGGTVKAPEQGDENMPLSEHEENVLAEIERQLAAEDPRFASRARRRFGVSRAGQQRIAIVLGFLGLVSVLALGFLSSPWNIIVPAAGFAMLLAGIILGVTSRRTAGEQEQAFVPPDDRS